MKSETVVPTENYHHNYISDQAFALDRWKMYTIITIAPTIYTIFIYYHHHHFAAVYIYPNANSKDGLCVYKHIHIYNCIYVL